MASVLSNTPDRLAVALFGKSLEFYKDSSRVICRMIRSHVTDDPSEVLDVMGNGVTWLNSPSPRTETDFGPLFGLSYRFQEAPNGQASCYALHGDDLGNRETPAEMLTVLSAITAWLTAAGIS